MKLKSNGTHFKKINFYELVNYSGTYSFKRMERRRVFAKDANGVYKEYVLGNIQSDVNGGGDSYITFKYRWQYTSSRLTLYASNTDDCTYEVTLCSFWAKVWNDEEQTSYTIYNETNWNSSSSSSISYTIPSSSTDYKMMVFDAPGVVDDIKITIKLTALIAGQESIKYYTYYNYPKTRGTNWNS